MTRRLAWLALATLATAAAPLSAQAVDTTHAADTTYYGGNPWRLSYFPGLQGGTNDGVMPAFRVRYFQQAAYDDKVTVNARLTGTAAVSFKGSFLFNANFVAPRLAPGWRLYANLLAFRENRFGYFGLGNQTEYNPDLVTDAQPYFYRARRIRYQARVDLTRHVAGPFSVALAGEAELARFKALDSASVFRGEFGSELKQDDASGRLALLFDTRDNEYDPHHGLLLELGGQVASGGPTGGYERVYGLFRGYQALTPKTVAAGRIGFSDLSSNPTLDARFTIPAWETTVDVLGGQLSNRGFFVGRYAGRGSLFGNLELRQEVKNVREVAQVMVVGFLDAGRVFENEDFRFTFDQVKVAGGVGVGIKLLRSTIFLLNIGRGPDGFRFSASNGWMF